jgi:hypothetical protein
MKQGRASAHVQVRLSAYIAAVAALQTIKDDGGQVVSPPNIDAKTVHDAEQS